MRSVVVVLPASMCAMMPMFRVFSSEYCRSTAFLVSPVDRVLPPRSKEGGQAAAPLSVDVAPLPAIMRERFVGLRHLVRVFPLLHCRAPVVGRVEQLGSQLVGH